MLGRITLSVISLIALSALSSQCRAQCPTEVIPLQAFTAESLTEVASIKAQLRFEVTSIKAGNESVYDLFQDPNMVKTNWRMGGYFRQVDRPLILKSAAELTKLRDTLIAEKADALEISLEDRYLPGWSRVPGLRSGIYNQGCAIRVSLASCDERTKLIYRRVSSITEKEWCMEGETARLEVNEAFYKLLNEDLENFMKTLPSPKDGPCVNEIELTKFLEAKGTAGFDSRGYLLSEGQKSFLQVMEIAMRNAAKDWSPYHLDVKIVGFGDHNTVKDPIYLLTGETGIDETVWNTLNPLKIYQAGCKDDRVKENDRRYFDFSSPALSNPIQAIDDNCELGAVRAFVAAAYLRSRLGINDVSYSYATGGIIRTSGPINAADRRINLEFTMNGARKVKMMPSPCQDAP